MLAMLVVLLATQLGAQTTLKATRGWGGKERTGRWNPVLVPVADATARNVKLEFVLPGHDGFAAVIEQEFGAGPVPATHELLTPLHYTAWQRSVVVLRDAETGKLLAQYPRARGASPDVPTVGSSQLFVGLSGRPAQLEQAMRILGGQLGYLPGPEMPVTSLGFDALDTLFLNQVDLRQLEVDQQQAILDWVRQGGSLLIVPAQTTVPTDSILGAALPCRTGDVQPLTLSADVLRRAAISARMIKLSGHTLGPSADARALELIQGSGVRAYWAYRGLGRIMVSPIDLAAIEFEESREREGTLAFWQPIVQTLLPQGRPVETLKYQTPYFGYQSETAQEQREGTAISAACDFLIPSPARQEWWRMAALVAMGILLVVGPLDSIVLKAIGRPHLTWTTIPGWMGLLALGVAWSSAAISGQARTQVRIVRVIDQVDDATVAMSGLLAADSARGAFLNVDRAQGWWEPVIPGSVEPKTAPAQNDLRLHESQQSCEPVQITVDSGRPRFLRWQIMQRGEAVIRASLLLSTTGGGPRHLTGSIRNVSDSAIKNLHIRTSLGMVNVPVSDGDRLQPQQEIKLDVVAYGKPFSTAIFQSRYQNYGYFGSRSYTTALNEQDLWEVVPDLAGRRSLQIDDFIERGEVACIYAQVVDPVGGPQLSGKSPMKTERFEWVRALVRLGE
jgi:hypothetical protein